MSARDQFTELERARAALWSLDPGCCRDEWVKIGMASKAADIDFDEWHNWSAGAGNYQNEAECRSVWHSFKDGGISASSLFHLARANGWTDNTETRPSRTESRQDERKQAATSQPPRHNPKNLWEACPPALVTQEYIERKLGLPDGLRTYHGGMTIAGCACDGSLVLPCRTLDGELASLQFIPPEGKKLFLPGVSLPQDGCFIVGGPIRDGKPVYLVEGIGQAWSAHQASAAPSVVCFGVSRIASVAKAIRARHENVKLVMVADAGKENKMAAIARDVHGAWIEMPAGSPSNYDLNDYHKERGLPATAALLERTTEPPQRFKLLTPADLAALPPVRWLVRGVLPQEGIGAFFGPSGCGKSFLMLDLLGAVAEGRDWFDCRTKAAPVLYIGLEGEAGISQRVKAYQTKHGRIAEHFRFLLSPLDIRTADDRAELIRTIQAAGHSDGILVIDTLNRAAPGMDENSSQDMGDVIAALKELQRELGGLVLAVHHSGKDATKGMRGHSSLHAALDAAIEVIRDGDRREWRTAKSKDGEDGEAHPFRLDVVEIGTDEDGEPVTSCVIAPEESTDAAMRRALPPRSGNQRIIWDALGNVLKSSSSYGQGGAAPTRPCVKIEDAIEKTKSRLVCDPKRQTERTQAAITGLINRGLIEHREGWIWIA